MIRIRTCLNVILLGYCLLTSSALVAAEELKVAISRWSPYVDSKLLNGGLGIDVVTSVFKKAGYNLKISSEKWPRNMEGVKMGHYDVIAMAWYSEQRAKSLDFTRAFLHNKLKFLVRSDSGIQFNNYGDLQGKLVGVVKKYAYGGDFKKATNFMKLSANHVIQNINSVLKKKIHATIADERVLIYKINSMMIHNKPLFKILPKPVSIKGLHVAVSRKNPKHKEIVAAFNKALLEMKQDGSYLKILQRHQKPKELEW